MYVATALFCVLWLALQVVDNTAQGYAKGAGHLGIVQCHGV